MKTLIPFCLCLTLSWANIMAQGKLSTQKLDALIETILEKLPKVPSVSIAIVYGDEVYYANAYGKADPKNNIPATSNTPYYTASVTKAFVGLLATILAQEGKLNLDVPITQYKPFSEFQDQSLFENITIREMLSHQSGLDNEALEFRHAFSGNYTQADNLRLLEQHTSLREEGKAFYYSNLGYNMLDILLKEEFGENWKELLKHKILEPLGMNHTSAYTSEADQKNWGMAWPYIACFPEELSPRCDAVKTDANMQAAGGMIMSAEDAAQWLLLNIHQGKLNGKQIYPSSLFTQIQSPYIKLDDHSRIFSQEGYGLGWSSGKYQGEEVLFHFGGFTGYYAHASFMPKQKIGLAIFVNELIIGQQIANLVAEYVYQSLLGQEAATEASLKKLEQTVAKIQGGFQKSYEARYSRPWKLSQPLENYAGTYVSEALGTLKISIKDQKPFIEMANLHGFATPYPRENTMRIELVPLNGKVVLFKLDENGKVREILGYGTKFIRKDS